jgi:hypothetical protein
MKRIHSVNDKTSRGSFWGKWRGLLTATLAIGIVLGATLAVLPAVFPAFGAETADFLRPIIGLDSVAKLESASFKLHDQLDRVLYSGIEAKPKISFSDPKQAATAAPLLISAVSVPIVSDANNIVTDMPQIGWQAYGPTVNGGKPTMSRALILMDPQRSYTGVALVRMDLSKLQLHMMTGTMDPANLSKIAVNIPNVGMVPPVDQNALIATFNGGFKGEHGNFGMMGNGITLLPPLPNLATVAVYKDGHVSLGVWGKDINPSSDMVSFRQNCPPLVENGQVNPALGMDNRNAWGYSGNSDITWRTGLGISQDGRYLIYAVGNGTSAQTLASSLQAAGAYNAMQLDINEYYAHFYTYQPTTPAASQGFKLVGSSLLDQMTNNPYIYLTPSPRDFFYLTTN